VDGVLEFREANPAEIEGLYRLRYEVYCLEKGFLSREDYPDGLEKDQYDPRSVHFLVVDPDDHDHHDILGMLRLIRDSELGFPIERHFTLTRPIKNRIRTVELSRLIVAKKARRLSLHILMGLSKEVYHWAQEHNVEDFYAVLEDPLLRFLIRIGLPFSKVGEEAWYMGAVTIPAYLSIPEVENILQRNNAMFYAYLKEPRGAPLEI